MTTGASCDSAGMDFEGFLAMLRARQLWAGQVAALPDPVGQVTSSWTRPNGLAIRKVRIPLGVVLMVSTT